MKMFVYFETVNKPESFGMKWSTGGWYYGFWGPKSSLWPVKCVLVILRLIFGKLPIIDEYAAPSASWS